ncbi:50S ribosomal protein L13 [Candidatus Saccharibacteria bacterium]|nr:50S ribosomal protein L13 [Candidatus Saccharibacteria bacterium]
MTRPLNQRTYSAKPTDVVRKWYILDASKAPLGRVATQAAQLLTGKGKPQFTHHIDCGDNVIIINSDKLVVTGNKVEDKMYYKYSGFPGGLTETTLKTQLGTDSTRPVVKAIRGMLPVNKLRDDRLKRLKVYPGAEHNHAPQKPVEIAVKEGK